MGTEWYDEDSHRQSGFGPKVALAGELSLSIDGLPVVIVANADEIIIKLSSLISVFQLRKLNRHAPELLQQLNALNLRTKLSIQDRLTLRLSPRADWVVRLLFPALR